ncbi:hypothetical protein [Tianweitania sediminis]|uniref:Uncharacterized protein n=1 Tax=Tianweitania sediminis TaxID=1502156 RepID=A0A8J7UK80_9HYPH|nr:hypothetical protein [Tianweitania sediminis]MBP0439605.1 hypothetical protein [Tianweitania sediminis]
MTGSPCLQCPLPECNEASKRCLLRRGFNAVQNKKRRDLASVTAEERQAYNEHFYIWTMEKRARVSEGCAG